MRREQTKSATETSITFYNRQSTITPEPYQTIPEPYHTTTEPYQTIPEPYHTIPEPYHTRQVSLHSGKQPK